MLQNARLFLLEANNLLQELANLWNYGQQCVSIFIPTQTNNSSTFYSVLSFSVFLSFCAIFQLFWWLVQEQESPYHAFLDIWSHLHLWCRNWSQGPTDTQGEDKGFIFFRLALKQIGNTVEHSVSDQPKCEDLLVTYENGTTGGQMYELLERKFTPCNRPLPSSKNPHFQNEARSTTFLVKMSFICMRMKNDFHINGWAPTLVLKQLQRPGELENGLFPSNDICSSMLSLFSMLFRMS